MRWDSSSEWCLRMNHLWFFEPQVMINKLSLHWQQFWQENPNLKSTLKCQPLAMKNRTRCTFALDAMCSAIAASTTSKFQSTEGNLLDWLKKECVFIESDSLKTDCQVTIGYFTKITSTLTHLANFHEYLVNQLMLVELMLRLPANSLLTSNRHSSMLWRMAMIISWSFPTLRFIEHTSATVEHHHKSLPTSLG